ncbi:J domain-containing protein [Novosphingobium aquimarinum]|uniref:J domain-containing protein n=1 Tax=Novosphingobium aquimarinum TaxID=2682494 RepID=UPI0012EBD166|nr:J domain-containing protein [Novosphingobium aquimarinum]
MLKLVWLVILAVCAWRLFFGRWPWQRRLPARRSFAKAQAQVLLGVDDGADRREILDAHRRLITTVHPDRGGSSEKVHEANAARDMLLADLPTESQEQ